jgi:hypothetical protein
MTIEVIIVMLQISSVAYQLTVSEWWLAWVIVALVNISRESILASG